MENKWEQWLNSPKGQKTVSALKSHLRPGLDSKYAINCLWWAFNAGNYPLTGRFQTRQDEILRDIIGYKQTYIPKRIKVEIKKVLDELDTTKPQPNDK